MAWWITVREIADESGKGVGRYRLTAKSDEDGGGPFGLCEHKHKTKEAAEKCPSARKASKTY